MSSSFNHFDRIAAAMRPACKLAVKKVALDAEGHIKSQIQANNQIKTGFMFDSVYSVTSDSSTYQGGQHALPEVSASNDLEAFVAVAAEYALYQNYGTAYLPPRPFFEPGMQRAQAGLEAAMELIRRRMEDAAR